MTITAERVRWVNVYCDTPQVARLQAEMNNPGYTAHAIRELAADCQWAPSIISDGTHFWRVELWA